MRWISAQPLVLQLTGIGAAAMFVPAAHALSVDALPIARVFLYCGTFALVLLSLIAIALGGRKRDDQARRQLLAVLYAFSILPALLAVPFHAAIADTTFTNAWFEMVSSITTTGATLYDPERLAPSLHLWRALVGWLGGLFTLIAALAILAPMNLGGFEVLTTGPTGNIAIARSGERIVAADPSRRVAQQMRSLTPVYGGLTLVLWFGLMVAGETPLIALCHAMSTLSTSGISPVGGLAGGSGGWIAEIMIAAFLVFAICRRSLPTGRHIVRPGRLWQEPEFRVGLGGTFFVAILLLGLHVWEALRGDVAPGLGDGLRAFWGSLFTVLSFLTTTGFASADWDAAQAWSGLRTPGLVLMGLCLVGGGVATTAGGVKLLRIFALYLHGLREMQRILHPHSIGGRGDMHRHLRSEGAFVAWIFFMLFALSIAVTVALLSLTGIELENSILLSITALTTTGPLAEVAPQQPVSFASLDGFARSVLAAAMIVGRMETLAIIALVAPGSWRQ